MNTGGLTEDAFEKLLRWLDPDRDKAGEKYERIRLRLIRIFACRPGCFDPEDLADQTINVVNSKIDWLLEHYEGDQALYFYGVAKNIEHEQRKKKPPPEPPPLPDASVIEGKCYCLERCGQKTLTPAEWKLLLRYHEKEKAEKIRVRKQIAKELGITMNALRIKVYHLQARMRPCIQHCLQHLLER